MKTLIVDFDDDTFAALKAAKGSQTWREFLIPLCKPDMPKLGSIREDIKNKEQELALLQLKEQETKEQATSILPDVLKEMDALVDEIDNAQHELDKKQILKAEAVQRGANMDALERFDKMINTLTREIEQKEARVKELRATIVSSA